MKNIFESAESFEAHATISAGYWMIKTAQEEFDKSSPKDTISIEIDKKTGYMAHEIKRHKKFLCECLIDIIEAKKVIEVDYANDEKFLTALIQSENDTTKA